MLLKLHDETNTEINLDRIDYISANMVHIGAWRFPVSDVELAKIRNYHTKKLAVENTLFAQQIGRINRPNRGKPFIVPITDLIKEINGIERSVGMMVVRTNTEEPACVTCQNHDTDYTKRPCISCGEDMTNYAKKVDLFDMTKHCGNCINQQGLRDGNRESEECTQCKNAEAVNGKPLNWEHI